MASSKLKLKSNAMNVPRLISSCLEFRIFSKMLLDEGKGREGKRKGGGKGKRVSYACEDIKL